MTDNPYRISVKTFREQEGFNGQAMDDDAWMDYLGTLVVDSVCPALCSEGCEVEPDGRCEHRCPSILLAVGLV